MYPWHAPNILVPPKVFEIVVLKADRINASEELPRPIWIKVAAGMPTVNQCIDDIKLLTCAMRGPLP